MFSILDAEGRHSAAPSPGVKHFGQKLRSIVARADTLSLSLGQVTPRRKGMRRHGADEAAARAIRDDDEAQKAEDAWRKQSNTVCERAQDWARQATNALRTAAKLRATTPAGIYAKALLVKGSAGSASALAMSLAEDFLACDGLRESLWPAGEAGA